jgi:hypothetical protein
MGRAAGHALKLAHKTFSLFIVSVFLLFLFLFFFSIDSILFFALYKILENIATK